MVRRGYLENLLHRDLFEGLTRLTRYDFSPSNKSFYRCCMLYIEVDQLLSFLRYLNAEISDQFVITLPGFLVHHLSYPILELTKAQSMGEVLDRLAGTPYQRLLKAAMEEEGVLIRNCEKQLYQYYYDQVFSVIDRTFHGKTRQQVEQLFAMQMDMTNLSTIQRLKIFYHQEKQEILPYLLVNPHTRFSRKNMEALLQAQGHQQILQVLSNTPYRHSIVDPENLIHSEQQALSGMAHKMLQFTTNSAAGFAAFLILSRQEVQNVVNIIEGIRYGLGQEEIRSLLVM